MRPNWLERMVERLRRLLGGIPPQVQAAALPWRRKGDSIEILLVTSRRSGSWILPKGRPKKGEPLHLTAERECYEEAGIRGKVSEIAIGSYLTTRRRARRPFTRVEIFVFPLAVEQEEEDWPERHKRDHRWLSPDKAVKRLREPELAALVRSFHGNMPDLPPR